MFEREIERNIADFRQLGIPAYIPRECRVHMADRMASTIIGARRAGKSFRALQAASEMISQGLIQSTDHLTHDFKRHYSTVQYQQAGRGHSIISFPSRQYRQTAHHPKRVPLFETEWIPIQQEYGKSVY